MAARHEKRIFPRRKIRHGDKDTIASEIRCKSCNAVGYHVNTGLNDDDYFRKKGWFVGNSINMDLCSECQKPRRPELKVVENMNPEKAEAPDAPREMTRDERLIIMDKIRDVNDGERYQVGWSDKAVGKDLGVPWAWVKQIREDVLLFKDELGEGVRKFDAEVKAIRAEIEKLAPEVNNLASELSSVRKRMDELSTLSKAVEREMAGR